jgi:D-glycero-alpha-D-manno-heptose-7-phosphate kinase
MQGIDTFYDNISISDPVMASAPCRIDSGGTWDMKALALPVERIQPVTINMALTLRTRVVLNPYRLGRIKISSKGFSHIEEAQKGEVPFDSPFGLFFAAVTYFNLSGLHIHIESDFPVKSALGGSSTALVALIKAISKHRVSIGERPLAPMHILYLAYQLEDAVSKGKCGIQDQAAAVYGGVNRWTWKYSKPTFPFTRESLLTRAGQSQLSERILVAYSGRGHNSSRINQKWVNGFFSGKTRAGWEKVNAIVQDLGEALRLGNWAKAARCVKKEMALRREITPDALIPLTDDLIREAEGVGCGARFAGAGGGGAIWALGPVKKIKKLRKRWTSILAPTKGGKVLDCAIDSRGVV